MSEWDGCLDRLVIVGAFGRWLGLVVRRRRKRSANCQHILIDVYRDVVMYFEKEEKGA